MTTAVPTAQPTQSHGATAAPTHTGFWNQSQTAYADFPTPITSTLQLTLATFTNLGRRNTYYLDVSMAATGWATGGSSVVVTVNGNPLLSTYCQPGDNCDNAGGPSLQSCEVNMAIAPDKIIPDDGGSIHVTAVVYNVFQASPRCKYNDHYFFAQYTIQGTHPIPTGKPSPAPSALSLTLQQEKQMRSESLNDTVTNTGALFYVIAAVAVVYAALALLLAQSKQNPPSIHQLGLFSSIVTMALIGSSFASEVFLVIAMLRNEDCTYLGYVVLSGRLLHPPAAVLLLRDMFRGKGNEAGSGVGSGRLLNHDLIFSNAKVYGALGFFCIADATALRYFPWLSSPFSRKSDYPTSTIFFVCVVTKIVQSVVTVSCQLAFLIHVNSAVMGSSVRARQSLAFLVINMITTVLLVIINSFEFMMKWGTLVEGTLSSEPDKSHEASPSSSSGQGSAQSLHRLSFFTSRVDPIPPQVAGDNEMVTNPIAGIEMTEVGAATSSSLRERMMALEEQNARIHFGLVSVVAGLEALVRPSTANQIRKL